MTLTLTPAQAVAVAELAADGNDVEVSPANYDDSVIVTVIPRGRTGGRTSVIHSNGFVEFRAIHA